MIIGYYYLHTNGSLIYKPGSESIVDIRDSDFAVGAWPLDPESRENAWRICVEGLAAGADYGRVMELADKWQCDDDDAVNYAENLGAVLIRDDNAWMAARGDFTNVQESPCGFGPTCLKALAALAKDLGYKPSKMWGATFSDLVKPAKEQENRHD